MLSGYKMSAKGDTGEIMLYEDIGEGWFGGISSKTFAKDLRALDKVKTLNIRINSPGGDVFDGKAIHSLLSAHAARKIIHVDGLAASIASIIAMAGDEIRISDGAMIMIHPAWGMSVGDAVEMRKYADLLETISLQMRDIYAKRTGRDSKKIWELMQAETWMTAAEAVNLGFADVITEPLRMAASIKDIHRFKNVPKAMTPVKDRSLYNAARSKIEAVMKNSRKTA
jgi:ATP-dependent Clp protease protease subunit